MLIQAFDGLLALVMNTSNFAIMSSLSCMIHVIPSLSDTSNFMIQNHIFQRLHCYFKICSVEGIPYCLVM